MKDKLKETAAGGAMGAGSVAVRMDGNESPEKKQQRLKDFLIDFNKKIKNRANFKMVPVTFSKLEESYHDIDSVVSMLKGKERESYGYEGEETVTYGVEDDEGNVMKVVVPADQAEEFAQRLGSEMADVEKFKESGYEGQNLSMAELLYKLKDDFNVIDVEFPTIPKDVVYNKDEASQSVEDVVDSEEQSEFPEAPEGEMSDMPDMSPGEEGEMGMGGPEDSMGDEMEDDGSVEDFNEEEPATDTESLLTQILDMMKSNAEADTARYNAEAEKARAKQAEYSAKAAAAEMQKQEELIGMEAELDAQKDREKEAKKMADLAKFNYNKSKSMTNESFLNSVLLELDEFDNAQSIRRQLQMLMVKYKPDPEDSPEQRAYKRKQMSLKRRELNIQLQQIKNRDVMSQQMDDENDDDSKDDVLDKNRDRNQ